MPGLPARFSTILRCRAPNLESPSALYDEASQLAIQRTIDSRIGDSLLPYTYPPFTAVVSHAARRLPFNAAFVAIHVKHFVIGELSSAADRTARLESEQATWLKRQLLQFRLHSVFLQGAASFILLSYFVWFTLFQ